MTKAEVIVHSVFTIVDIPKSSYEVELCVKKVQELLDMKCTHPMNLIKVSTGGMKSDWMCTGCNKEVIATKYEEVK